MRCCGCGGGCCCCCCGGGGGGDCGGAEIVKMVENAAEQMSLGLVASSMITDDGIIDPRDTRIIIGFCLSVINNSEIKGTSEFGVFRL